MASNYIAELLDNSSRQKIVDQVCKAIIDSNLNFHSIIVCGLSGILLGPEVLDPKREVIIENKS